MGIRAERKKQFQNLDKIRGKRFMVINGDSLSVAKALPSRWIQMIVCSPPYWSLRSYEDEGGEKIPPTQWPDGWIGHLGFEPSPEMFIEHIVVIFREYFRVLRNDGTLWLDIGDTYIQKGRVPGYKKKDLCCIPHRVANALREDGWYFRIDNVWHKTNPVPHTVYDRPTHAHEYVFLFSKKEKYFYDRDAIREKTGNEATWEEYEKHIGTNTGADSDRYGKGYRKRSKGLTHPLGRNKRSVWSIATQNNDYDHYATFPPDLPKLAVLAGTSEYGSCKTCSSPWKRGERNERWEPTCDCGCEEVKPCIVLDPFSGTATTGEVALRHGRRYIGVEISKKYFEISARRLKG